MKRLRGTITTLRGNFAVQLPEGRYFIFNDEEVMLKWGGIRIGMEANVMYDPEDQFATILFD